MYQTSATINNSHAFSECLTLEIIFLIMHAYLHVLDKYIPLKGLWLCIVVDTVNKAWYA